VFRWYNELTTKFYGGTQKNLFSVIKNPKVAVFFYKIFVWSSFSSPQGKREMKARKFPNFEKKTAFSIVSVILVL